MMNKNAEDVLRRLDYGESAAIVAEICDTMASYDCAHWGLRIVSGPVSTNDILPPSRKWVDGVATDALLPGTSAVAVDAIGVPAANMRGYVLAAWPGAVLMLIGGDSAEPGEDDGELIIADAYCYWTRTL